MPLSPGERLDLIREIADGLSSRDWSEVDLILSQFGLPSTDMWSPSSAEAGVRDYVLDMLRYVRDDDDALVELADYVAPRPNLVPQGVGPWQPGRLAVFLSHIASEKRFTADVSEALGRWGIDAFVAHENIAATAEWMSSIEVALHTCDALVALLHEGFIQRRWCDQEVGIAYGLQKFIIPIRLSPEDPHGFLSKYQALEARGDTPSALAGKLARIFFDDKRTRETMIDGAIEMLVDSGNFAQANGMARVLQEHDIRWTDNRLKRLEAALENPQVAGGYDSQPFITKVLEAHRHPAREDPDVPF